MNNGDAKRSIEQAGGLQGYGVPTRAEWVDVAKGIGIVLVVLGHAIGGVIDAGLTSEEVSIPITMYVIYTFHMPLFFFLSGLFANRIIAYGNIGAAKKISVRILYPMMLWAYVQITIIYVFSDSVNRPIERIPNPLELILSSLSHFWYLAALIINYAIYIFAVKKLKISSDIVMICIGISVSSISNYVEYPVVVRVAMYHSVSFFIGAAFSGFITNWDNHRSPSELVALAISAVIVLIFNSTSSVFGEIGQMTAGQITNAGWQIKNYVIALLMIFLTLSLSKLIEGRIRILSWIGRVSMPIYLLHVIFSSGSRIFITRYYKDPDPYIVVVFAATIGIIAPIAIYLIARSLRIEKLFGLSA